MPGFPDKFMPFMDQPPGGTVSSQLTTAYGAMIRSLRGITNGTVNKEPKWRHNGPELTTGYNPRWSRQPGRGHRCSVTCDLILVILRSVATKNLKPLG
jgi:hydrogenase small subunit